MPKMSGTRIARLPALRSLRFDQQFRNRFDRFVQLAYVDQGLAPPKHSVLLQEFIELGLSQKVSRLSPVKRRQLEAV